MPDIHSVQDGDSVESIAYENGLFWETVWNAGQNAELRMLRKEPNILEDGDSVYVPDRREKTESLATGRRHVFRRRGVPSILRVRLLESEKPRRGLPYKVITERRVTQGVTDADGWVKCFLMPDVKEGVLQIVSTGEAYPFTIGTVNPAASIRGLQTRLRNLGYYNGGIDGEMSEETRDALLQYQRDCELAETGDFDGPTRAALLAYHGS